MTREERLAWLLDHHRRPRYRAPMPDADAHIPGGNPGCGDIITLHVKSAEGQNRVAAVSWEGTGCTLSQAAASILAERVNREQPAFEEVLASPYEEMLDLLGRDVAAARPLCATLALGTLKAAVKTVEMNRKLRAAGLSDEDIRRLRGAA